MLNPIIYITLYPVFLERTWSITSSSEDWFWMYLFTFVPRKWRFLTTRVGHRRW